MSTPREEDELDDLAARTEAIRFVVESEEARLAASESIQRLLRRRRLTQRFFWLYLVAGIGSVLISLFAAVTWATAKPTEEEADPFLLAFVTVSYGVTAGVLLSSFLARARRRRENRALAQVARWRQGSAVESQLRLAADRERYRREALRLREARQRAQAERDREESRRRTDQRMAM